MDTFEQYEYTEETVPRKASPFADSPYECVYEMPSQLVEREKRGRTVKNSRKLALVSGMLALILICCALTGWIVTTTYQNRIQQINASTQQQIAQLERRLELAEESAAQTPVASGKTEGLTPQQIYTMNAEAVVGVDAYGTYMGNSVGSMGSGFIVSPDGYVVTNYHVVQEMDEYYVILQDETELTAELIGFDAAMDVAVLKVDGENLPCVQIGSSDRVQVGDQVVAIGYPLDSVSASLTVGYISVKDQIVDTEGTVINMMQTDAAINSGNSGGPLFDMEGNVVGITTAKFSGYSSSGASIEGMGFAIPIDDVLRIIEDLRDLGYVTGAYLGVYVLDVDSHVQMYGLPAGAYVDEPMEGLAADRAGILTGDVIIALGGYDVKCVSDLTSALRRFDAGDQVSVTVWRAGKELTVQVTLDEKPQEEQIQQDASVTPETEETMPWDEWFFDPFFDYFGEFGG